jgi:anti-sigma B factor antagonist
VALSLSTHQTQGVVTLSASGEIDLPAASELETRLGELAGSGVTGLVVDLAGVTFLDSAGINALLKGRRLADTRDLDFQISNATGLVRQVLEITGVWQHLAGTDD